MDGGPSLFELPAVGAIVPYAGAKRTDAAEIVSELGPHSRYDDVFCGSLAVPLAKPPATMESVNDMFGDLINLARVLKGAWTATELYARLHRVLMHEDLFHEAASAWADRGHQPAPEAGDVDRAEEFMICSWFGRNGVCGTQSYNQGFSIRYTSRGGSTAKRWHSAVECIPAWHERLRAMTILNRDGFELLEKLDDAEKCVIYCDPPYLQKGFRYVHDFETEDHERLARLLHRFKRTRVVLSYYEHPALAELYPGWSKREIHRTKNMAQQNQRGIVKEGPKAVAPEVLLINGRSFVELAAVAGC